MAENSAISWTDHTWSPWIGCTKISPACDGCYAAHLMDTRLGRVEWGPHGERRRTSDAYWRDPARWNRIAVAAGQRETVFPSLCDPFDNQADPELRREWFGLIRDTPSLVWLLLSKRPQNILRMVDAVGFMPPNIAFGTTCEDRARVETNLPHLMRAAALRPAFLFASFEPLLGGVGDLTPWLYGDVRLGWGITGGETDQGKHKARPTHPAWVRDVRDQCAAAGVPFHFKQWGAWAPGECVGSPQTRAEETASWWDERWQFDRVTVRQGEAMHIDNEPDLWRVGKARAGRLLDGVAHDGMPDIAGRS